MSAGGLRVEGLAGVVPGSALCRGLMAFLVPFALGLGC